MIEHIDFAIVPKKHTSLYLMHKYWARKPHNVVAEYIKRYTKEGDVILDPFCGSGVTVVEALRWGRKAIGIDLDPMAIFITRCTGKPIDLEMLEEEFIRVRQNARSRIYGLFKTKCPTCGSKRVITHVVWKREGNDPQTPEEPMEIWYECEKCAKNKRGKILRKIPEKEDFELLNEIQKQNIPFWCPENELIWNSRINVWKGERVSDLFTKRALIGLSTILNEIEKTEDADVENILKFVFTSSLVQASRMIPYQGGFKTGGGSWKVRGYWIPKKHFEINTWNCFENRFEKILKGKKESNEHIGRMWREGEDFQDLHDNRNVLLSLQSALELENIPSNSIDYVFTDPPYGDSVPYLELHYMWSSWLRFEPNFSEEIIISDSPVRNRGSKELYALMLSKAFREIFRVLKPNYYLTLTFHNADIEVYNSVIRSVIFAGFELDKIVYQPPAHPSSKAMLAPYGSAEGDYYIRFRKPKTQRKILTEKDVNILTFRKIVIEAVKGIIVQRGEPVTYNDILKQIYIELDRAGYLTVAKTEEVQKILDKYKDKEFIFIEGEGWWLKDPEKYYLHITPLQDRVEKFIIQLLKREIKISFDDALQEIFLNLQNALTPEPTKVRTILEEYADPIKGGKWRLKRIVEKRIREHNQMIGILAEIGKKYGFDIHIGKKEQNEVYEGMRLHEFTDREILTFSDEEKEIDILWIKDGKIVYAFEVEFTTGITEAVIRGSYITSDKVKRVFVIPEERERLLHKKVNAPILKTRIIEQNWKFIFFKDLKEFHMLTKGRKKIEKTDFDKLSKELMDERSLQTKLPVIKK